MRATLLGRAKRAMSGTLSHGRLSGWRALGAGAWGELARAGGCGELAVAEGGDRLLAHVRASPRIQPAQSGPSGSRWLCTARLSGASSSQKVARAGARPALISNRR